MVTVFCDTRHSHLISRALPDNSRVHTRWDTFKADIATASCLAIVLESIAEHAGHVDTLAQQLSSRPHLPLVLSTRLNSPNVNLMGRLRFDGFIPIENLERELLPAIETLLPVKPRHVAAQALLGSGRLTPTCARIVTQVLTAEAPVRDEMELAARLGVRLSAAQRQWRTCVYPHARVPLKAFICWGRRLRESELFAEGWSVLDVAVLLGVDTTTVYRDIGGRTPRRGVLEPSSVLAEFLHAFHLVGGAVQWGKSIWFRRVMFRFASDVIGFAKVGALNFQVRKMRTASHPNATASSESRRLLA
jgi:hypothetical protein